MPLPQAVVTPLLPVRRQAPRTKHPSLIPLARCRRQGRIIHGGGDVWHLHHCTALHLRWLHCTHRLSSSRGIPRPVHDASHHMGAWQSLHSPWHDGWGGTVSISTHGVRPSSSGSRCAACTCESFHFLPPFCRPLSSSYRTEPEERMCLFARL